MLSKEALKLASAWSSGASCTGHVQLTVPATNINAADSLLTAGTCRSLTEMHNCGSLQYVPVATFHAEPLGSLLQSCGDSRPMQVCQLMQHSIIRTNIGEKPQTVTSVTGTFQPCPD